MTSADFTNTLSKLQIERLAEADEHELVKEVQVSRVSLFSSRSGGAWV